MWPFNKVYPSGTPWIDYQEIVKTTYEQQFLFKIENFLSFILREICVTYPADVNGRSQLPLKATANVRSTTNLFQPIPIPPELFSSPSQNYRQGALNEDPAGFRFRPLTWHYPFVKGDILVVSVTGVPTGLLIGCMITGRKYGGEQWQ
jgi:hypothetical protein